MSQLNFFLTQEEILSKLKALIESGQFVVFMGNVFDTNTPEPITHVSQLVGFRDLILWVKNSTSSPLASVKGSSTIAGKFLFDYLKDPIVEVTNCTYTDKLISSGRIYFKAGWIEDERVRNLHKKLGNKILRLFDKGMIKVQGQWRISTEVKEWVLKGGELELGVNGLRINKDNINAA